MLKIHQLFLRNFILLFVFIFICSGIVVYFWIQNLYMAKIENKLHHHIDTVSMLLTPQSDFEKIAHNFKKATGIRFTLIQENGVVIAESDKPLHLLKNHKNREEVLQAKKEGVGTAMRISSTVSKENIYLAKKITLGEKVYYLRMADYYGVVKEEFSKLALQISTIFLIIILIALFLAYRISEKIKVETDHILYYLQMLTKKKKVTVEISTYTKEFNKITKNLQKVSSILAKRRKQKAKQTAKLKASNRQKDDIISALSHEFKNPIAVITGYSETIMHDESINKQIMQNFLKKIFNSANRMSNIIDRLRLSIKLEEGKQNSTFKKFDLKPLCNELVDELCSSYKDRNIRIQGQSLNIYADETLLAIAISNLIENALKYSDDEVIVEINNNTLKIVDQGMGIEKKELKKITKKFYRTSKNGWNNSLGLGLSIVKNILDLHHFKLQIQSQLDHGSTFTIQF